MQRHTDLLAAVRAGLTTVEIAAKLGVPESTVRYQAARNGLTVASRKHLTKRGEYWQRKMRRVWARMARLSDDDARQPAASPDRQL